MELELEPLNFLVIGTPFASLPALARQRQKSRL